MLIQIPLWEAAHREVTQEHPAMPPQIRRYQIIRRLIDRHITDLIETSAERLQQLGIHTSDDVRAAPESAIAFSDPLQTQRQPLRRFLFGQLYRHYRVVRMSDKAHRFVRDLFIVYRAKPEQLPPSTQRRIATDGLERSVCDYIAGMTDRYALEEHQKLFDPYTRV
jgi:dGTPase